LSPPGEFDSQRAAWGSTELLAYERVDRATNLGTIVVISRATGVPCPITPPKSDNRNPAWSP
jgi:hypothetical protein